MKIFSCRSSGCSWAFRHRQGSSTLPALTLHAGTWIRIWITYLFVDTNTVSLPDAWGHVSMVCKSLWKFETMHWYTQGEQGLYYCSIHFCWLHDIIPNKINSNLNCRCQLGEPKKQSWSVASVHPLHCFAANTDSVSQLEPQQKMRCLDFNSAGLVT